MNMVFPQIWTSSLMHLRSMFKAIGWFLCGSNTVVKSVGYNNPETNKQVWQI